MWVPGVCVCVEGSPPHWDRTVPWWAGSQVSGEVMVYIIKKDLPDNNQ